MNRAHNTRLPGVKHRNCRCANRYYSMTMQHIASFSPGASQKTGWCRNCADRGDIDCGETADPNFNYILPTTSRDMEMLWKLEAKQKLHELVEYIDESELKF